MGNVNSIAAKADALQPGDHIFIWDRRVWPVTYQHHGIVWKSGESIEDVQVCHVWTPLEGFRQAQADSSFRVSTLEQFLYHRSLNDLRLVEYEGHKASRPDVVLTRCRLLLGRGRGDYHVIIQNCEHAARWCKTGSQWSSQTLTPGHGTIPFEDQLRKVDVLAMKQQVAAMEKATAMIDSVKQGLRVETQGRTLFWLDSFSAEMVNVRQGLARQVFKSPPIPNICHGHFKNAKWNKDILWGNSSRVIGSSGEKPRRGVNWFRHVEFATFFLRTPFTLGRPALLNVEGVN